MKKIAINHFIKDQKSNGVCSYINEINKFMRQKFQIFFKPYNMDCDSFRYYVFENLNIDNIFIEAPESQSSTLYLSRKTNIHIRMHCPYYLYKKIIFEKPDQHRFSDEIRAMYKAKCVSSPSHGMLDLLDDEIDKNKIHVYKNPVVLKENLFKKRMQKDIDVIFFSRFNNLKGIEYIEYLLDLLPCNISFYIVGKQEKKIKFSKHHNNVVFIEHIEGDEKYNLLSQAKVAISLSKFENCSMAILEALSVGVPVVCWEVGGNSEIAPPECLSVVPFGDIYNFSEKILYYINNDVEKKYFIDTISKINNDFEKGVMHIKKYINNETNKIYKGLSFSNLHREIEYIPYECYENKNFKDFPINILLFTSTVSCSKYFSKYFNKKNINIYIVYKGKYFSEINNIAYLDFDKESSLDNIIKKCKLVSPDIIFYEKDFKTHIDNIFYIRQSLNIPILFCFSSLIDNGYMLDPYGFDENSDIFKRKIKIGKFKRIEKKEEKICIWLLNRKISKEQLNWINKLINNKHFVDIVSLEKNNDYLYNEINCNNINIIDDYKKINYSIYSDIISINDKFLNKFFPYTNNIYIWNKSIYNNKNIMYDSRFIEEEIIINNYAREKAQKFLDCKSSNNNEFFNDIIFRAVYYYNYIR